jgi:subtilase family serine protease
VKSGKTVQAPTSALRAPADLAGSVLTVTGLNTAPALARPMHSTPEVAPPAGFRNARPCSKYYGQVTAKRQADYKTTLPKFNGQYLPYAVCGYTGPQFRAAYENNLDLYGAGATIAITDAYAAPTIRFDAEHYAERNGDASYAPGRQVVNQNRAQIVSNSWSDVEQAESAQSVRAYEKVFMQGAMQGISFLFSSGDNGDEVQATGLRQVDYPASDPYATGVGGTATAIGADGSLEFQTGWGTHKYSLSSDGSSWTPVGYLYGAGGGQSALFNRPSYQDGIVHSAYRMVPDIAMDADPTTGMLVGETQQFPNGVRYGEYRIGGTSLASPQLAGFTALGIGVNGGHGLGFLNPTIYSNAHSAAFYDVKGAAPDAGNIRVDYANSVNASDGLVYSARTFNQNSSLTVRRGWDDVTGVGVPTPQWVKIAGS